MTGAPPLRRSGWSIFVFWAPLAATWLMMAFEGPFLAAVIARLPEAKFNLAAFGVAVAFAILVEAPVIMLMSASTALVEDASSFRKLRNFTYSLNALVTGAMVVVLIPPVFSGIAQTLIGLTDEVARLTYGALIILLPWPGAIGYRRFFQGLLIRGGKTRLVAYGTVLRLTTMTATAIVLYVAYALPGAYVGAAALSVGVCAEALASRLMAHRTVRAFVSIHRSEETGRALDYRRILEFYYPLAMTSIIGLVVPPMLTFFMGRARAPVESLAVFPVVNALAFMFRAFGLSYQEVAIALLGKEQEHAREIGRFALGLALAASLGLAFIAFTPLVNVWFETVSGLSPELASVAITPTRIFVLVPALSVFLSLQRAILVRGNATRPITWATVLEVIGIALLFVGLSAGFDMVGVTAAVIAFTGGRLAGTAYLVAPCYWVLEKGAASLPPAPR